MKILAKRLDAYCKHVLYIDHLTFSAQATFVLLPNNKLFRIDSISENYFSTVLTFYFTHPAPQVTTSANAFRGAVKLPSTQEPDNFGNKLQN